LPAPEEETRTPGVRFTANLPTPNDPYRNAVPPLPLDTEPFDRPDSAILDDRTIVDPTRTDDVKTNVGPAPRRPPPRDYARTAVTPRPQPPPRTRPRPPAHPRTQPPPRPIPQMPRAASAKLPLQPPPDIAADAGPRSTNPGSISARIKPASIPAAHRAPPPVRTSDSAVAALKEHEDQHTAVAEDPLAPLRGPLVGGRYHMVKRIGEGGMGKVFKVTHAQLGKTFALKIIHHGAAEDDKARESFFREARLASSLSHPNIASVVDFGEDPNYGAFMVMEFLEGEMLSQTLHREKHLSLRQTSDIVLQVAEALQYIHSHRIVHCDIKTENILMCDDPTTQRSKKVVKLLDFGLARSTSTQRHTGSLSGTPHYVAPERIRGEPPTPQSDIYGLGILFYELITGSVPWDGNVAQILCGHLEKQPLSPSSKLGAPIDPAVEQLIFKALKKHIDDRHKDMSAFIYELRTVMDMLGFGRRSKRRGSRKKVVIERRPDERDELARAMFDHNRLPMAMINEQGMITVANAAFAKFVMGVAVDVEGLTVQSTPLANAWATFEQDLEKACAGEQVRRIIEFDLEGGRVRRLLMWLDPAGVEGHACFGIHPLDT
jgi:serine/threonine protein kinase